MNEPENPQSATGTGTAEENWAELRRVINLMFAGLVITSFTLTAYLAVQGRRAEIEAKDGKAHAEEAMKVIQQDDATIQVFFTKLEEYGRTHPDFQNRVLAKYKLTANPPAPGSSK
jgi:hypothetical protein